jgi:hypothetical protein
MSTLGNYFAHFGNIYTLPLLACAFCFLYSRPRPGPCTSSVVCCATFYLPVSVQDYFPNFMHSSSTPQNLTSQIHTLKFGVSEKENSTLFMNTWFEVDAVLVVIFGTSAWRGVDSGWGMICL